MSHAAATKNGEESGDHRKNQSQRFFDIDSAHRDYFGEEPTEAEICDILPLEKIPVTPLGPPPNQKEDDEMSEELFPSPLNQENSNAPILIDEEGVLSLEPNSTYCGYPAVEIDPTSTLFDGKYLSHEIFETKHQIVCLKAPMGTGKTTALFTYLGHLNQRKNGGLKFIIVCPTKSLIESICEKYGVSSYLSVGGNGYYHDCVNMVITPNSFHRCLQIIAQYDLIILDEVEGSLRNITSNITSVAMKTGFMDCLNAFFRNMILKPEKRIILMDALLKTDSLDFFLENRALAIDGAYIIFNCFPVETEEYKKKKMILYYNDINDCIRELFLATRTRDPVIASFSDKSIMEYLARLISVPSTEFLNYIGIEEPDNFGQVDVVTCSGSVKTPKDKTKSLVYFVQDPDEFIKLNKHLFHTSVVQSGVSLVIPCRVFVFAKTFMIPDAIVQMMGRARNPIGRVSLHIDCSIKEKKTVSLDEINETFINFFNGTVSPATKTRFKQLASRYFTIKQEQMERLVNAMSEQRLAKLYAIQTISKYSMNVDGFQEIKKALTMDARCWDWKSYITPTYINRRAPLNSLELCQMLKSFAELEHKTCKVMNQMGICVSDQHVESCVKTYGLFGIEDNDKFRMDPESFRTGFDFINETQLERFTATLGFGSFLLSGLVKYSLSSKEIKSCNAFYSCYSAMAELLFILYSGKPQDTCIEIIGDAAEIFVSDPRKFCETLELTPLIIVAHYSTLIAWFEKHSAVLLSNSISFVYTTISDLVSTNPPVVITSMISDIVKFFKHCGVNLVEEGDRNKSKRLKTKSVSSLINECRNKPEMERHHAIDGVTLSSSGISKECLSKQIPLHKFKIDEWKFCVYLDISMRHFRKLVVNRCGFTHPKYRIIQLDTKQYSEEINRLFDFGTILCDRAHDYCQSPSWWLYVRADDKKSSKLHLFRSISFARTATRKKRKTFEYSVADYLAIYDEEFKSSSDLKFQQWGYKKRTIQQSEETNVPEIEEVEDEDFWTDALIKESENVYGFDGVDYFGGDDELFEEIAGEPIYNNQIRKKKFE